MRFLLFWCVIYIPTAFAYTRYDVVCNCTYTMEDVFVPTDAPQPDLTAYQKCGEQIAEVLTRKNTPLYKINHHTVTFKHTVDSAQNLVHKSQALIYKCQATATQTVGAFKQNSKSETDSALQSECSSLIKHLMQIPLTFTNGLFKWRKPFWVKDEDSHVANCTPPLDD